MEQAIISRLDWTFHHDYEIEQCAYSGQPNGENPAPPISPADGKVYFFPANLETNLERSTIVTMRVKPAKSLPFVGVFAYGFDSRFATDVIFSCPDPEKLCVVCGGYSYIVKTHNPMIWERLPVVPVVHAFAAPEHDILVFGDFTRFAAYGVNAVAWVTEQVTWDGIKIAEVSSSEIRGFGWEAPTGRDVEFRVNLSTGTHIGGTAPRRNRRATKEEAG
jgi:hypothetical protein